MPRFQGGDADGKPVDCRKLLKEGTHYSRVPVRWLPPAVAVNAGSAPRCSILPPNQAAVAAPVQTSAAVSKKGIFAAIPEKMLQAFRDHGGSSLMTDETA